MGAAANLTAAYDFGWVAPGSSRLLEPFSSPPTIGADLVASAFTSLKRPAIEQMVRIGEAHAAKLVRQKQPQRLPKRNSRCSRKQFDRATHLDRALREQGEIALHDREFLG